MTSFTLQALIFVATGVVPVNGTTAEELIEQLKKQETVKPADFLLTFLSEAASAAGLIVNVTTIEMKRKCSAQQYSDFAYSGVGPANIMYLI